MQIQINRSLAVAAVFGSEAREPAHDGFIFRQAGCPQDCNSSFRRQDVEQRQQEPSQAFALHRINHDERPLCDRGLLWHPNKSGYANARNGRSLGGHRHPGDVVGLIHFGEVAHLGL